jgi:long-chain fatty acid transport protein
MKQKKLIGLRNLLLTTAAVAAVGLLATNDANATNGYFAHGYSIKNKGLAGAGAALPLDGMAVSMNPAGLTEVGDRVDLGLSLFSPMRSYTVEGNPTNPGDVPGCNPQTGQGCPYGLMPGKVDSDSEYFFIPNFAWTKQLNEQSAIGIAVYGNGGMNTDYDAATFNVNPMLPSAGEKPTGVDLMQLFIAPTYAHKFAEKHSFGITPIIAAQFFEAQGLHAFGEAGFSSAPDKLTNNGHDTSFGFGGRIGYLGKFNEKFSLGLSWQSKIYMDEFDDYAGLFAEQGDFDIPSNWTIGVALSPTPEVTIAVDVQQIYYSDVKAIANPMLPNLNTAVSNARLGDDEGAGFGWEDETIFKIGLQWARTEQWTYRFGYSYGEQPIPSSLEMGNLNNEVMFNILAPAVPEHHATFGLTYTFENKGELDFSFMYAFENDVTGLNPLDPAQTITLTMNQWEVGVGYSWVF